MSDGCKDNQQQHHYQQQEDSNTNNDANCSTRNPVGNNDFVETIAKNAVAQICDYEGFQGFHNSALQAFADVAVKYVLGLGKTSVKFANRSGRGECNVFDVVLGLENLGSVQGFAGASNVACSSVAKSGTVREISLFVSNSGVNPYVFTLPRFPVSKSREPPKCFLEVGVVPPCHVPPWLPAFPVPEERVEPGVEGGVSKAGDVDMRSLQQQRQEQSQQQQLAANNGGEGVEINPFLAPPFAFGEKEVSIIEPPSRIWEGNHVHSMDMFAQVEEPATNDVTVFEDVASKHVKLDERPSVRFKFRDRRKSLRVLKNVVAHLNGEDETVPVLVERNDENDEKKRRAEQILKESMETPLDTTEL